ncbi:RICIN domain-containing protein [Streptomyces gilvosporeus]|uniref:RICIN domain-containing protein n=1 Tax=Streptomyces gilvosporeus TaxID=553510 RepID=UPI00131A71ED|nr:helix-turn-helix domain-containing protein [Streptomyces gilvosporeus]
MGTVGGSGAFRPGAATDADAFAGMLQQLRDYTGLTEHQLERWAAQGGYALAPGELADVLRRRALPRPEAVEAFVRACGGTDAEVHEWLTARQRIEDVARLDPAPDPDPVRPRPPASHRKSRRPVLLAAAAALAAALVILGVRLLIGYGAAPGAGTQEAAPPLPAGEVHIRPLRAPGLCLTGERIRRAHAAHTVAVQRPCAQAVPPHTYLKAAGPDRYRIEWDGAGADSGCLSLLSGPGVEGLLEPDDDCSATGPAQRFRIEAAGKAAYRIELTAEDGADSCLGIEGGRATASGALARAERCTGADGQRFLIGTR